MYLPPYSLCNITGGYVSTSDNWKTTTCEKLPSFRKETDKSRTEQITAQGTPGSSTWMRVSGNEMAKSELMTACLPARCDLQIDLKTFPSQFRLCILVTCTQRDILEGNRCLFFLAVPLNRYEVSPNSLAWSVVSASFCPKSSYFELGKSF